MASLIENTVRRPVAVLMLLLIVMLIGLFSCSRLPSAFFPDIEFPTLTVTVDYDGAGPEEIEDSVIRILEKSLSSVSGIKKITSTSKDGYGEVELEFDWGTDLTLATVDVREKLDQVIDALPDDAERPVIYEFSTADIPIVNLGIVGVDDLVSAYDFIDNILVKELEQIPGISFVGFTGAPDNEIHVDVIKNRLLAYNLSIEDVLNLLLQDTQNVAGGSTYEGTYSFNIRNVLKVKSLEELRNVILTTRDGVPIRVRDIATVTYTRPFDAARTRINGDSGLVIVTMRKDGGNSIKISEAIHRKLADMKRDGVIPPTFKLIVVFDTTDSIRASLSSVQQAVIQGAVLAMLILFIYMWDIRALTIIGTSIPVAIVVTFIAMYFSGVSLNLMSLSGLSLGVGMMVDSSIVVLENIFHYRNHMGYGRYEAAIQGAKEVWLSIMASTFTTVAVFMPILFVPGLTSFLFRDMSLTVIISLLASLVVSVSLIPMLSALLYRKTRTEADYFKLEVKTYALLDRIDQAYGKALKYSIHNPKRVLISAVLACFLTIGVVGQFLGSEFFPATDEGRILATLDFPTGTRVEYNELLTEQIEQEIIAALGSDLVAMRTYVRGDAGFSFSKAPEYRSSFLIRLTSAHERDRPIEEALEIIRGIFAKYPIEANAYASDPMGSDGDPLDIKVRGPDLAEGLKIAQGVVEIMQSMEGVRDARVDLDDPIPELVLKYNRAAVLKSGLTPSQVATAIQYSFDGEEANRINSPLTGNEVSTYVQFRRQDRIGIADLHSLKIRNDSGELIPLSSVVEIVRTNGPTEIRRESAQRTTRIRGGVFHRPAGDVIIELRDRIKAGEVYMPPGYVISYEGSFEDQQETQSGMVFAFLGSLIMVYAIMASQFESFVAPFVILFSVPFGVAGAMVMLLLLGHTISAVSMAGVVVLIGIVINNGIVLIDYIDILVENEGLPINEAARRAGIRRLRPISMTTLTTVLGLVPMAMGLGQGGESYAPLAASVLGGLTVSTLFTLILVPTVYSAIRRRYPMRPRHDHTYRSVAGLGGEAT